MNSKSKVNASKNGFKFEFNLVLNGVQFSLVDSLSGVVATKSTGAKLKTKFSSSKCLIRQYKKQTQVRLEIVYTVSQCFLCVVKFFEKPL